MLSPGSRLGKYQIERPLGRGGMGAVFLATDTVLRRPVAIKVLVSEADSTDRSPARLLREARNASALNHPNIVGVYEIGEENAVAFISMEYVQGQPLSEIVEGGSLTVEQSIRYAIEAADALAHAHDRGIVHSDLKAANAILSSSGRIKLVDFGIAGRLHHVASDAIVTSTATRRGLRRAHLTRWRPNRCAESKLTPARMCGRLGCCSTKCSAARDHLWRPLCQSCSPRFCATRRRRSLLMCRPLCA